MQQSNVGRIASFGIRQLETAAKDQGQGRRILLLVNQAVELML
jgi:hypothetical protein